MELIASEQMKRRKNLELRLMSRLSTFCPHKKKMGEEEEDEGLWVDAHTHEWAHTHTHTHTKTHTEM